MAVAATAGLWPAPVSSQATVESTQIHAVRYGTVRDFPLRGLLPDAPPGDSIDIALAFWVVRTGDRVVLFDSGFFRERWRQSFRVEDYERPDRALGRLDLAPGDVTDIVISHAHWDHMGGIELFPAATLWIQAAEYAYYTGHAWQPAGRTGGIDREDVEHLVRRNLDGRVRLVNGDGVEVLPGIRVHIGSRHTYQSQYLVVEGPRPVVLASDNAYLYRNLSELRASATFLPSDRPANVLQVQRMLRFAGPEGDVVPGHDPEQFIRYPREAPGVVRIRD